MPFNGTPCWLRKPEDCASFSGREMKEQPNQNAALAGPRLLRCSASLHSQTCRSGAVRKSSFPPEYQLRGRGLLSTQRHSRLARAREKGGTREK